MIPSCFENMSLSLEEILVLWTTVMLLKIFAAISEIKSPKGQNISQTLFSLCIQNISQHWAHWKKPDFFYCLFFFLLMKKHICKIIMKPDMCLSVMERTKLVREHRRRPMWLYQEQTAQYHSQQILASYLACLIRTDMITILLSAGIAQLWGTLAKY